MIRCRSLCTSAIAASALRYRLLPRSSSISSSVFSSISRFRSFSTSSIPIPISTPAAPVYRTHFCSQLSTLPLSHPSSSSSSSPSIRLSGFIQSSRSFGAVYFAVLRDSTGTIQLITENPHILSELKRIPLESSVTVQGKVQKRPDGQCKYASQNGQLEFQVDSLIIHNLNQSILPFDIQANENTNITSPLSVLSSVPLELRLQHRYLDLRRPINTSLIQFRSQFLYSIRSYFHHQSPPFQEIETPLLFRSTPEGASEFLVPTRSKGEFYALPQSPQQFKQLLIASGVDRYFQIARCFRDEGMRMDRQPEFTQLDIELAYPSRQTMYQLIEGLIHHVLSNTIHTKGVQLKLPMQLNPTQPDADPSVSSSLSHMSYLHAMERFGSDKPDLRFGLPMVDLHTCLSEESIRKSPLAAASSASGSSSALPTIKAILAPGLQLSRSEQDKFLKDWSTQGFSQSPLLTVKVQVKSVSTGDSPSSFNVEFTPPKAFAELFQGENKAKLVDALGIAALVEEQRNKPASKAGKSGEWSQSHTLFLSAGQWKSTCTVMGKFRLFLAQELEKRRLISLQRDGFHAFWVVDFPLFEGDLDLVQRRLEEWQSGKTAEEPRLSLDSIAFASTHHPFTRATDEQALQQILVDMGSDTLESPELRSIPLRVSLLHRLLALKGEHYDLVINGNEIGGGSLRIHTPAIQENVLKLLGANLKSFHHLLTALKSGTPPHGGIALGLDRFIGLMAMKLWGEETVASSTLPIREVIAFPKTSTGRDLLTGAPSRVPEASLSEYHIEVREDKDKETAEKLKP